MRVLMTMALATSLVACGGDGSSDSRAPNEAEGLWLDVAGDGTVAAALTLVQSNGEFWFFHEDSEDGLHGVVYGLASGQRGEFASSTAYAYGASTTAASVTGVYQAGLAFTGTIDLGASGIDFSSAYVSEYETPANMAHVETASSAPSWLGTFYIPGGSNESLNMDVAVNGSLSGSIDEECQFSGTITPRADVNVFDVSATFQSASDVACTYENETLQGIAIVSGAGVLYGALHGDDGHIAYAIRAEQQLVK